MRKLMIGVFFLLATAWTAAAWDEPEGFMGLKWGASVEVLDLLLPEGQSGTYPSLMERESRAKSRGFSVFKERIRIESALFIDGAWFYFLDGKFVHVSFVATGDLVSLFTQRYGKPHSIKRETLQNRMGAKFVNEILTWQGDTVTIKLETNADSAKERLDLQRRIEMLSMTPREQETVKINRKYDELIKRAIGGITGNASIGKKEWDEYQASEARERIKDAAKGL